MSYSKETTIWCDDMTCAEWSVGPGDESSAFKLRKYLEKEGWASLSAGIDLCPRHNPHRKVDNG